MAGLLDYGTLARFLMSPVEQVSQRNPLQTGIEPGMGVTEGARGYSGGANSGLPAPRLNPVFEYAQNMDKFGKLDTRINELLTKGRGGAKLTGDEARELRALQTYRYNRNTWPAWQDK